MLLARTLIPKLYNLNTREGLVRLFSSILLIDLLLKFKLIDYFFINPGLIGAPSVFEKNLVLPPIFSIYYWSSIYNLSQPTYLIHAVLLGLLILFPRRLILLVMVFLFSSSFSLHLGVISPSGTHLASYALFCLLLSPFTDFWRWQIVILNSLMYLFSGINKLQFSFWRSGSILENMFSLGVMTERWANFIPPEFAGIIGASIPWIQITGGSLLLVGSFFRYFPLKFVGWITILVLQICIFSFLKMGAFPLFCIAILIIHHPWIHLPKLREINFKKIANLILLVFLLIGVSSMILRVNKHLDTANLLRNVGKISQLNLEWPFHFFSENITVKTYPVVVVKDDQEQTNLTCSIHEDCEDKRFQSTEWSMYFYNAYLQTATTNYFLEELCKQRPALSGKVLVFKFIVETLDHSRNIRKVTQRKCELR